MNGHVQHVNKVNGERAKMTESLKRKNEELHSNQNKEKEKAKRKVTDTMTIT